MLYVDVDRMHVVNDNYGMHVGDRVIAKLGELIRSRLVPGALAARISGDRFALLLPTGLEEAAAFADALRVGVADLRPARSASSSDVRSQSRSASASRRSRAARSRMRFAIVAETACKAAKDRGRNRVELYQASDLSLVRRYEDINIAPNLRAAMIENRLRLDAQLIVPLQPQSVGTCRTSSCCCA